MSWLHAMVCPVEALLPALLVNHVKEPIDLSLVDHVSDSVDCSHSS